MSAFERSRDTFRITTDVASMDVDAIHAYLTRSYWAEGIPKDLVARAMAGSLCFGLLDAERQVGLARVVTDRATYAYLCDVYVLEEYQGRGLGTWMMRELMTHPDLQGLRRWGLVTRDAHGLYKKFGFTSPANPAGMMEIARPGMYLKTRLLAFVFVLALTTGLVSAQGPARSTPTPTDAVSAILDVFRTHSIVTLPDAHGSKTVADFTYALIRDPRFPMVVNDIVYEGGNARFQPQLDRYVNGENVAYDELQHVWNDGIVSSIFVAPDGTIPDKYRIVREVNRSLPRERRLRVLLGEPPIDWSTIGTPADFGPFFNMRETYPAAVLQVEVRAKRRHALVVYGEGHTQRKNEGSNYDMSDWRAQTIVSILEAASPDRVFSIFYAAILPKIHDVARWPVPSLATVRGTTLGAVDYGAFDDRSGVPPLPRAMVRDGKIVLIPKEQWKELPLEEQFDAVLYLGADVLASPSPQPTPSPICSNAAFLKERLRRMEIGGAPGPALQDLRKRCGVTAPASR
ncbi:MAG TPA: GNAT family N-acetyltransferase [Vicinamibacterales bacterium]|nr:GNAT family N-acetyltransferase [Vicinamibacterales bacterium]